MYENGCWEQGQTELIMSPWISDLNLARSCIFLTSAGRELNRENALKSGESLRRSVRDVGRL